MKINSNFQLVFCRIGAFKLLTLLTLTICVTTASFAQNIFPTFVAPHRAEAKSTPNTTVAPQRDNLTLNHPKLSVCQKDMIAWENERVNEKNKSAAESLAEDRKTVAAFKEKAAAQNLNPEVRIQKDSFELSMNAVADSPVYEGMKKTLLQKGFIVIYEGTIASLTAKKSGLRQQLVLKSPYVSFSSKEEERKYHARKLDKIYTKTIKCYETVAKENKDSVNAESVALSRQKAFSWGESEKQKIKPTGMSYK